MDIVRSFIELIPVTLAQSLIYAFVALAVMIPFRLLNFPDLSCEGTFPLGGCVCGALLAQQFRLHGEDAGAHGVYRAAGLPVLLDGHRHLQAEH